MISYDIIQGHTPEYIIWTPQDANLHCVCRVLCAPRLPFAALVCLPCPTATSGRFARTSREVDATSGGFEGRLPKAATRVVGNSSFRGNGGSSGSGCKHRQAVGEGVPPQGPHRGEFNYIPAVLFVFLSIHIISCVSYHTAV